MSHKLGRLCVPYALLTIFGASILLASANVFYAIALGGQVGFYLLAGYGAVIELRSRPQYRAVGRPLAGAGPPAREVAC